MYNSKHGSDNRAKRTAGKYGLFLCKKSLHTQDTANTGVFTINSALEFVFMN